MARWLDNLRNPTPARRRWTMLIVFLVAAAYLYLTAVFQDRDLVPKFHDEHMHLLQMRMLAHGRLWMPPLPAEIADFFDTFHVLVRPKYASIYWPGTALLFAPTIWLRLPFWLGPLIAAAASAALFYRIAAELIDGMAGLLAALLLISLNTFRFLSLALMSHGVIIFFGLAIVCAYLNWRREKKLRWALIAGALVGWAAITRPIDAIAFSLPVAIAVVLDLRTMSRRGTLKTLACVFAAAAPFLALQLIANIGITGHLLESPYHLYAKEDSPNLAMGFGAADSSARPQSKLAQKRLFYEQFLLPDIERHAPANVPPTWWNERFPLLVRVALPSAVLLIFIPFAGFALKDRRWVLAVMWPVYCLLYAAFPFLLRHYAVVAAPSILFCVLLGKRTIQVFFPPARRNAVGLVLTLLIAILAVRALPELDRDVLDDGYLRPTMWFAAKEMPKRVQAPAIVLFRFAPGDDFHEEPVYNVDSLTPDDAPIIRAHDLGLERDRALFDYYARRQPERNVYLFDRKTRALVRLGKVAELARRITPATNQDRGPSSSGPM